jgi:hypothetical protein
MDIIHWVFFNTSSYTFFWILSALHTIYSVGPWILLYFFPQARRNFWPSQPSIFLG